MKRDKKLRYPTLGSNSAVLRAAWRIGRRPTVFGYERWVCFGYRTSEVTRNSPCSLSPSSPAAMPAYGGLTALPLPQSSVCLPPTWPLNPLRIVSLSERGERRQIFLKAKASDRLQKWRESLYNISKTLATSEEVHSTPMTPPPFFPPQAQMPPHSRFCHRWPNPSSPLF